MNDYSQGDIIKIDGFKQKFLIISKTSFINALNLFHVCPIMTGLNEGPLHIRIRGLSGDEGIVACEQIKLIDPASRQCFRTDRISYIDKMNISDCLQGIFEYD